MNHMQWTFPFVCDDFPLANSTTECVNLPEPEPFTGKVSLKIRHCCVILDMLYLHNMQILHFVI